MPERDAADDGIERRRRYIICGDNSLSYRLIAELGALPDTDVVVVSRRRHGGASAVPETAPDICADQRRPVGRGGVPGSPAR